jgi:hypothetical protein
MPRHIRKHWVDALRKELTEIIKKGKFKDETPGKDDLIIPITVKYRIKIEANGTLDKLKARIAFRGDLLKANAHVESTWCPVTGFRALRIFLCMAVEYKACIYQLDYVAAFLQAKALGHKSTKLPSEWKESYSLNNPNGLANHYYLKNHCTETPSPTWHGTRPKTNF